MRRKHDRITILLVEDNPGDAALVREMLLEAPGAPFAVQWSQRLSDALVRLTSTCPTAPAWRPSSNSNARRRICRWSS